MESGIGLDLINRVLRKFLTQENRTATLMLEREYVNNVSHLMQKGLPYRMDINQIEHRLALRHSGNFSSEDLTDFLSERSFPLGRIHHNQHVARLTAGFWEILRIIIYRTTGDC